MEEYHRKRAMTREELLAPIRERIASVEEQIRESKMPGVGTFTTHNKLSRLKRLLRDLKTELATIEEKRIRNLHKNPFANSDEDDPARLMGSMRSWRPGFVGCTRTPMRTRLLLSWPRAHGSLGSQLGCVAPAHGLTNKLDS